MERIPTEGMSIEQIADRCLLVPDTPIAPNQARDALFYLDVALAYSPYEQRRFADALDYADIPHLPIQP